MLSTKFTAEKQERADMNGIQKTLFSFSDIKYRDFQSKLIPSIEKERIIGVRTPSLRALAKQIKRSAEAEDFLSALPHFYFEENQLHSFIISDERDFEKCAMLVDDFLPYIDNWATCDQLSPKCFAKQQEKLFPYILKWLRSSHTYTVRFAIVCLMRYFLDGHFDIKQTELVAGIKSDEYYIKMAVAWYFATALAKQYDSVLPFITEKRLDIWTHNKAIQKSRESFRISIVQKEALKKLKR